MRKTEFLRYREVVEDETHGGECSVSNLWLSGIRTKKIWPEPIGGLKKYATVSAALATSRPLAKVPCILGHSHS